MSIDKTRETFNSKLGFILACIGSAVGMGNIWMFPYRVGQFGGAAFLIAYFIFIIIIGITGLAGEMAFGRAMNTGPIGSFQKAAKTRNITIVGQVAGIISTLGSLAIAIGYSVVIGWIIKFTISSFTGSLMQVNSSEYFENISTNFGSIPYHLLGLCITFILMLLGINNGIEKINKIIMPSFFILFSILAIRIGFLPGSSDGYKYLFKLDLNALKDIKTWIYALGQAFFSLSIAGSGTIVYGSYLKKSEDIISCAKNVALFDTIAAMLSAMVIIPAVFAFGLNPTSGPSLMFITIPKVFQMMPMGNLFMILFFIAVLFAGISSLINLFETPIESLQNELKISRKLSVLIVFIVSITIGIMIESGYVVSIWMDVISIYIIPLGALISSIMFFWICPKGFAKEQVQLGRKKELSKFFDISTKYIFVALTFTVYIIGMFYGGIG